MRVKACYCPETLEEAVSLLAQYGPELQVCAGGTDLLVMMRKGRQEASCLLDLSALKLAYIRETPDVTISIGAMATLSDVSNSSLLDREPYLCLRQAARHVGSAQIRNMATLVGNICTGISSADCAVPLLALGAKVKVISSRGTRVLPVTAFFEAPRKTAVQPDELVTELLLEPPPKAPIQQSFFRKVGTRRELFISVFNAAACLSGNGAGAVMRARLAMGVVAPVPIRLFETEAFLTDRALDESTITGALEIMQGEIRPRSSHHGSEAYRRSLASNILRGFLIRARMSWQQR